MDLGCRPVLLPPLGAASDLRFLPLPGSSFPSCEPRHGPSAVSLLGVSGPLIPVKRELVYPGRGPKRRLRKACAQDLNCTRVSGGRSQPCALSPAEHGRAGSREEGEGLRAPSPTRPLTERFPLLLL